MTTRRRKAVDVNGEPISLDSDLEAEFDTRWRQLGGPPLFAQYHFAPPRKWAFDRCHVHTRIAIEIDGGTWNGGRHTRGAGFRDDCIKLNAAQLRGWFVFRLTSDMLRDPDQHIAPIIDKIVDLMDEGDEYETLAIATS